MAFTRLHYALAEQLSNHPTSAPDSPGDRTGYAVLPRTGARACGTRPTARPGGSWSSTPVPAHAISVAGRVANDVRQRKRTPSWALLKVSGRGARTCINGEYALELRRGSSGPSSR